MAGGELGIPRGVSGVGDMGKGTIITLSSASPPGLNTQGSHHPLRVGSRLSVGSWLPLSARGEAWGAGGSGTLKKGAKKKEKAGTFLPNPAVLGGRG